MQEATQPSPEALPSLPEIPPSSSPTAPSSPLPATPGQVLLVVGTRNVLKQQIRLQELAQRFGQPAAMHGVEHFLQGAGRGMTPYLLFALADPQAPTPLAPRNILGAALLHEFQILGFHSRIFVTEGKDGLRSIIAPAASRALIAATISAALLECKAQIIVASYVDAPEAEAVAPPPLRRRSFHWATATRPAPGYLPLQKTLEQTIDLFNKKTRRNFRYYRRQLEAETPLEFVPEAGAELTLATVLALNRGSLEPVSDDLMRLRHKTFTEQPGAYLCGLRTQAGEWLALVSGWRQSGTTVMQWQLNVTGFERFSLVTVARSFWIEHEIALGSKVLRMDGGTPHAMNHSFIPEKAVDLILCRRSLRAFAMVKILAPLLANPKLAAANNNFLAKTLSRPDLNWRRISPTDAHEPLPRPSTPINPRPATPDDLDASEGYLKSA